MVEYDRLLFINKTMRLMQIDNFLYKPVDCQAFMRSILNRYRRLKAALNLQKRWRYSSLV
jgi:hypothetical protein